MWTCIVISQDLKPIVQIINSNKHFCFNIEQSRFLTKRLEHGLYQDSIIDTHKLRSFKWRELVQKKDTIIFKLETKVDNLFIVQENNQSQIEELNLAVHKQNKRIKRYKLERWFLSGSLLVLTGIIITK